ncbi:hypothetical protein B0J13DRAFT_600602 [Dactylonectria estremocensis]|uniref:Zn(2)-C6 fungal-type domain-containing protein n=1 Tax=Dactylonectria estremocensis TaxID=1079267 RepID=A0A9P9I7R5_9HYPO|nr:hypothetical protein B0J13DRAFT_600602 [Dactylonectria estremocensis]
MEPLDPRYSSQSNSKPIRTRHKAPWACLQCRERKVRCDVSRKDGPCTKCCMHGKTCITLPSVKRARAFLLKEPIWDRSPHAQEVANAEDVGSFQHTTNALISQTPTCSESSYFIEPPADSVLYLNYHFLSISNLPNMPSEDINYLDIQGCLLVPRRQTMDFIVHQYFLHVHPFLPLLDERYFWDMYTRRWVAADASSPKISLLVFQALFVREAKTSFYQKAKVFSSRKLQVLPCNTDSQLLYDFGSESSSICIAQSALLLSYRSSSTSLGIKELNTTWLNIAIQHAEIAEATNYACLQPSLTPVATENLGFQNVLKRLWWCCIIRDRVLSLCLRRRIQVGPSRFDFATYAPLRYADLENEIQYSRVYCERSKRFLIDILEKFVELCVVLTDILALVYPLDKQRLYGPNLTATLTRVLNAKNALREWEKEASPPLRCILDTSKEMPAASDTTEVPHDSVTLYVNLIYIYYQYDKSDFSSWLALCHYEALTLASQTGLPYNYISTWWPAKHQNQQEIHDAALAVTRCLKALHHLNLDRWLPSSAVACTATPLVLHMLDVKLAGLETSSDPATSNPGLLEKNLRLNAVIQTMKIYYPQYDSVDFVINAVRHIAGLVSLEYLQPTMGAGTNYSYGWMEIFSSNPNLYLRLALTIDLGLSQGRLPQEEDFPARIAGTYRRR